ncbi:nif-specific transcriptional activator NifA [Sorangium sp. So ce513]|uniref:nif-specific transcriptional activator NifA n=1 Tax=Sorangium sp. So ce513 TaxID=3133315 RepID=UPI003F6154EA
MPSTESAKSIGHGTRAARSANVALYGVYEISKLLTEPARLEVTLAKVLQLLSSFLDMRRGLIALLGDDGTPEVVVGSGWSEATAKRYFEHLPEQAIGRIVVTRMPLVVENMKDDPLFQSWDFSEWESADCDFSFIGVPIKDRGHVIGTLTIDRERTDQAEFGFDDDVRFLTMIANLLGQTVRLQRLIVRDRERLIEEQHRLEKLVERSAPRGAGERPTGIVGDSAAIRAVLDTIRIVARSHSTVLLRGESGTGKELFARALHDLSPRKDRPFVTVNCAALPEGVLESELFGHEKGAFTGAAAQRKGRFELADGGTLFLDEIGEISPAFQAKLLRVLQESMFERVGGSSTLKVDVRIVAATNKNLEEAVALGEFRADLYYRISVVPIFLPPLRDRPGDICLLACEFLRRFNDEHGTQLLFTDAALSVLASCRFPGNVRELENCVRRTATLAQGSKIVADDFACRHDQCLSSVLWRQAEPTRLPPGFVPLPIAPTRGAPRPAATLPSGRRAGAAGCAGAVVEADAAPDSVAPSSRLSARSGAGKSERERLIEAMEAAGWVQAKAARLLDLTPRQIGYALRKYDIPIKKF